MLYVVTDGLLGTNTNFGLFGKDATPVANNRRYLFTKPATDDGGLLTAGSTAALLLA